MSMRGRKKCDIMSGNDVADIHNILKEAEYVLFQWQL